MARQQKWSEVHAIRSELGLGLREAHDAYLRYGSAAAATEALKTPEKRDAYENEYDRLRATNRELLAALQLVRMSAGWQALSDESRAVIDAAIAKATGAAS